MERVLYNKVRFLAEKMKWDVSVVTTDQHGKQPFYPFPDSVKLTDLGINYSEDNVKGAFRKICGYLKKRKKHKKMLSELLMREKADIVVSLYPSESSFIPDIKDGSKKVLEIHYCKFFRLQYGRKGLLGAIDRWRTRQDERIVSRFDKFVVLTNEDRGYWGNIPNITVIPNAAMMVAEKYSDVSAKRVIAVGRLDYQKGFDRLVKAWEIVQKSGKYNDWRLDIFGQGEWKDMLQNMINERNLNTSAFINKPVKNIGDEYAASSMLVMSSNYEGFPMVMIEAMACGLPVVAFRFKCGPEDIISEGENGMIVDEGDIEGLAYGMMKLMDDDALRKRLSDNARNIVSTYSEKAVMEKWIDLFNSLTTEQ